MKRFRDINKKLGFEKKVPSKKDFLGNFKGKIIFPYFCLISVIWIDIL